MPSFTLKTDEKREYCRGKNLQENESDNCGRPLLSLSFETACPGAKQKGSNALNGYELLPAIHRELLLLWGHLPPQNLQVG